MADKKKPLTDEEWAQLVADKVNEGDKPFKPNPPDPAMVDERRQFTGALDSAAYLPGGEAKAKAQNPAKSVEVAPQDPVVNSRTAPDEPTPAEKKVQDNREGVIYLQNTLKDGTKEKGAMVARKMFASDADFDKFVERAKSQDNLWNPANDHETSRPGSLAARLASFISGATPDEPFMKGGNVGKAVTTDGSLKEQAAARAQLAGSKEAQDFAARGQGGGSGNDGSSAAPKMNQTQSPADEPFMKGGSVGKAVTKKGSPFAPVEDLYKYGNSPGALPPGTFADGSGGGGGSNPPTDAPVSVPGGMPAPGDPTLPMANGGNNALSVPGYALGAGAAQLGLAGPDGAPTPASAQMAAPPLPNLGGSSKASASFRGAPGMPSVPSLPDRGAEDVLASNEMARQAGLQSQAIRHAATIVGERDKALGKLAQDESNRQDAAAAQLQRKVEYVQGGQQKQMNDMLAAQQLLNNPAKTPDPERYWNNHSKIMFAIGVGLLTQAGKDTNGVLSNVSREIDRDVEAQKAAFEAPRAAARGKLATATSLYGMLRDQGHDAFEASKMASSIGKAHYLAQIEKVTANNNSQLAQANGAAASAKLLQDAAKDAQDALAHREQRDVSEFNATETAQYHRAEIAEKYSAEANKKTAGEKAITDAQRDKLGAMKATIDELRSKDPVFSGRWAPFVNWFSSFDPSGSTDASNWDKNRQTLGRAIAPLITRERISEGQMENFIDQVLPKSYSPAGKARYDGLVRQMVNKYDGEVQALGVGRPGAQPLESASSGQKRMVRLKSGEMVEQVD